MNPRASKLLVHTFNREQGGQDKLMTLGLIGDCDRIAILL